VDPLEIRALAVVGQNPSLVCVDENGLPTRPAIIWADQRATREATKLSAELGSAIDPSSHVAKAMWVRTNDQEAHAQTRWFLLSFDYVLFRLTGQPVTVAVIPGHGPWPPEQLAAGDLDSSKVPPRTFKTGEVVGELSPAAAQITRLRPGLPVVAGTIDSFAAWLGTAILEKGILCSDCGSTTGVALCWNRPLVSPENGVQSVPHPAGSGWIAGAALSSGSNFLDWFVQAFYTKEGVQAAIEQAGCVPPGSEGLLALPYLLGERGPVQDPAARGVFFGIGARHKRAHFARAVLESVAFAVRDACRTVEQAGGKIEEIRLAGGGAKSHLWNRIKADVLGKKLVVPEVVDSALLGSAMIAAAGVGALPDLRSAVRAMFRVAEVIEPEQANHELYSELFEIYRSLYRDLRTDFAWLDQVQRHLAKAGHAESRNHEGARFQGTGTGRN
jgi:xylulokinase